MTSSGESAARLPFASPASQRGPTGRLLCDNQLLSVAAHSAYPLTAPGPRVRIAEFVEPLRAHDVELRFQPALTPEEYAVVSSSTSPFQKARTLARASVRLSRSREQADVTVLHRLGFLTPIPGVEPPKALGIYDFDDALYLGSIGSSHRYASSLKNEAGRWRAMVRRARTVIAGNSHLAGMARRETSRRVEVVPSCVNPDAYEIRRHVEGPLITVGWIGSRSTSAYLAQVLPAMERLNRDRMRARFLVIGGQLEFEASWLEVRPWQLASLSDDLAEIDIGVMPMPDSEWARGKCGYKLLQYFAAGIPAVASPVGIAPKLLGKDRGLSAKTTEEWVLRIRELADDVEARKQIGSNGRRLVEAEYSHRRWAPEIAALLSELA